MNKVIEYLYVQAGAPASHLIDQLLAGRHDFDFITLRRAVINCGWAERGPSAFVLDRTCKPTWSVTHVKLFATLSGGGLILAKTSM